jgi:hypothetical protein
MEKSTSFSKLTKSQLVSRYPDLKLNSKKMTRDQMVAVINANPDTPVSPQYINGIKEY